MTTPAQQQQPQTPQTASDGEITAVVGMLATGAAAGATAAALARVLKVPASAAVAVLGVIGTAALAAFKRDVAAGDGDTPDAIARRANIRFRAAYIINAARRIATAPDIKTAIAREKTYWSGHKTATARRTTMARRTATASRLYGPVLGWKATMDNRTTAECRAANGRNFQVLKPPVIGYPGTVHLHCRCIPVAPYPGAKMVDTSTTVQNSDAASGFHR